MICFNSLDFWLGNHNFGDHHKESGAAVPHQSDTKKGSRLISTKFQTQLVTLSDLVNWISIQGIPIMTNLHKTSPWRPRRLPCVLIYQHTKRRSSMSSSPTWSKIGSDSFRNSTQKYLYLVGAWKWTPITFLGAEREYFQKIGHFLRVRDPKILVKCNGFMIPR